MLDVRVVVAFGEGEWGDWKRAQKDWGCLQCYDLHYDNSFNYTLIIYTHFCVYAIPYLKVCMVFVCFF